MSAAARRRGQGSTAQRGFTLPELLVAMASVGLVLTGLVSFLVAGQRSFLVGANQVESQQNVRIATHPGGRQPATYQQGEVFVKMTDTARIRNPGCEPKSGA